MHLYFDNYLSITLGQISSQVVVSVAANIIGPNQITTLHHTLLKDIMHEVINLIEYENIIEAKVVYVRVHCTCVCNEVVPFVLLWGFKTLTVNEMS